jgi:hypothetical protein
MKQGDPSEARASLSAMVDDAAAGEEIIIAKNGRRRRAYGDGKPRGEL